MNPPWLLIPQPCGALVTFHQHVAVHTLRFCAVQQRTSNDRLPQKITRSPDLDAWIAVPEDCASSEVIERCIPSPSLSDRYDRGLARTQGCG